jgi:predicted DNA-binding protein
MEDFMAQVNARIDKGIYDRLSEYSETTGVPVSRCIAEACERWLTVVAPTRIEAMRLAQAYAASPRRKLK